VSGYSKRPLSGVGDYRHGTDQGYSYYGCRCDRCREAHRESHRRWRTGAEIRSHGIGGYEKGCRCQVCKHQKRKLNESYLQRRKLRDTAEKFDMSKLA